MRTNLLPDRYLSSCCEGIQARLIDLCWIYERSESSLLSGYRRRRKFTTSIQPAKAYEDESVMLSGPH